MRITLSRTIFAWQIVSPGSKYSIKYWNHYEMVLIDPDYPKNILGLFETNKSLLSTDFHLDRIVYKYNLALSLHDLKLTNHDFKIDWGIKILIRRNCRI